MLSGTGFAQLSTASLSGVVRDSSGAVVPNTKVVLRNVATAVEKTTTSNGVGAYLFSNITPGRYTVQASAPGFAEQQVPEFALTVGQAATIDFALTVGSAKHCSDGAGRHTATGNVKCQSRHRSRDDNR